MGSAIEHNSSRKEFQDLLSVESQQIREAHSAYRRVIKYHLSTTNMTSDEREYIYIFDHQKIKNKVIFYWSVGLDFWIIQQNDEILVLSCLVLLFENGEREEDVENASCHIL